MRERTTWNRDTIKAAASRRVAEDPRAMNQDHLSQQPAADKYVIGTPSDFAEDVHPSAGTWKAEYSGGEVKRNEIGMPEMRGDTFNHPEKTAAQQGQDEDEDEEFLEKKADVCLNIAKRMLPKTASESAIEDQALALMHLPNEAVIQTAQRLAAQDDEEQGQGQSQQKQAQQDQGQGQGQDESQQKQAQQDQGQGQAQDEGQSQQKQAQGQQQDDQGQGQQQDKQAQQQQAQGQDEESQQQKQAHDLVVQACQAFQQGNPQAAQQAIQKMVQATLQSQPVQSQEQLQQVSQQIQQLVQQAFQQQMAQGQQQQQPMAQQDDLLLDQMLQQQPAQQGQAVMASASTASMDIELEGPSMDVGEVHLASDDEALMALFANNTEVREATQANALLTGIPVQASTMNRTAATRTIGTRPSVGVSQLGGGSSSAPAGGGGTDVDKLSSLWQSAPDVRGVFGS